MREICDCHKKITRLFIVCDHRGAVIVDIMSVLCVTLEVV